MAGAVSGMFMDPVGSAQDTMMKAMQETEEQRRKRMMQQKMSASTGMPGMVSNMLMNNSGNQF